jgi:hypothetical protein
MAPPSNHPITTRLARFLPEHAATEIERKRAAVAVLVDTIEVFHPRPHAVPEVPGVPPL